MPSKSKNDQHLIATMDYICADSPNLISDIQTFCQNWIPKSHNENNSFFNSKLQPQLETIITEMLERDSAVTLPALYEAMMLTASDGEE